MAHFTKTAKDHTRSFDVPQQHVHNGLIRPARRADESMLARDRQRDNRKHNTSVAGYAT